MVRIFLAVIVMGFLSTGPISAQLSPIEKMFCKSLIPNFESLEDVMSNLYGSLQGLDFSMGFPHVSDERLAALKTLKNRQDQLEPALYNFLIATKQAEHIFKKCD